MISVTLYDMILIINASLLLLLLLIRFVQSFHYMIFVIPRLYITPYQHPPSPPNTIILLLHTSVCVRYGELLYVPLSSSCAALSDEP